MLSLNDSIITGLLLPKYDLFHMANSLLWFVTIDYYDHHLDFLKIMNQHPVSKTRFKGFAGETEVQKKWEQILVSSWGWVVSPTIYTGFSDASDASRLPGGWEQPSWNRHQWIASFPKVVKYWPAKSHLQQTWGVVRHYFIHQHLQRYRSFSATFLTLHATCPSYSHMDPKNNHHRSYHKSFQTHEFWCIKNHPMDFLFFSISPKSSTFRRPRGDNCHWYPGCLRGSTRRCDIFFPASDADDELSAWSCVTVSWKNPRLTAAGESNHPDRRNLLKVRVDLKFQLIYLAPSNGFYPPVQTFNSTYNLLGRRVMWRRHDLKEGKIVQLSDWYQRNFKDGFNSLRNFTCLLQFRPRPTPIASHPNNLVNQRQSMANAINPYGGRFKRVAQEMHVPKAPYGCLQCSPSLTG